VFSRSFFPLQSNLAEKREIAARYPLRMDLFAATAIAAAAAAAAAAATVAAERERK